MGKKQCDILHLTDPFNHQALMNFENTLTICQSETGGCDINELLN